MSLILQTIGSAGLGKSLYCTHDGISDSSPLVRTRWILALRVAMHWAVTACLCSILIALAFHTSWAQKVATAEIHVNKDGVGIGHQNCFVIFALPRRNLQELGGQVNFSILALAQQEQSKSWWGRLIAFVTSWPILVVALLTVAVLLCWLIYLSSHDYLLKRNNMGPLNGIDSFSEVGDQISDHEYSSASRIKPVSRSHSLETIGQIDDHLGHSEQHQDDQPNSQILSKLESNMNEMGLYLADRTAQVVNTVKVVEDNIEELRKFTHAACQGLMHELDLSNDIQIKTQKELVDTLKSEINELSNNVTLLYQQGSDTRKELSGLNKRLEEEFSRLENGLTGSADQQSVKDEFYGSYLGLALLRNPELARGGEVAELAKEIGDNLNRFFQEGIPNTEGFQTLGRKVYEASKALRLVSEIVRAINPAAATRLSPYVSEAERLVNQFNSFQGQSDSRDLQLNLQVPVSALKSARYTFLEQLGRAIEREVEKWRDPQSYWTREIDHFVTSGILRAVRVCEENGVAPPGERQDVDRALTQLFERAGLEAILPKQGDLYESREHELNRMIPAAAGSKNETIARMMNRGFYYEQGGQKRLLRKALVDIYR